MSLGSKLLLILDVFVCIHMCVYILCVYMHIHMHVWYVYIHINPSKIIDGEPVKNNLLSFELHILKTFFLLFVFISEYTIQHYIFPVIGLWLFHSWGCFFKSVRHIPGFPDLTIEVTAFPPLNLWSHSILCWRLFVTSSILVH